MKTVKVWTATLACLVSFGIGPSARADFWGGDIPLLTQIVATTLQQLVQLKSILGNGIETFHFLQDINRGIQEALAIINSKNSSLSPGVLSELSNLEEVVRAVERLYGRVPVTSEADLQKTNDRSVAEAIHVHNEAYRYAQTVDTEAERIKEYSRLVSPLGAQRMTAQSMGVLIQVMDQVLRTNASILKAQTEQLALDNRRQKLGSEQFKAQYEGLSKAFGELKPQYDLPSLSVSAE